MSGPTLKHVDALLTLAKSALPGQHLIAVNREGVPTDGMMVTSDGLRVYLHRYIFAATFGKIGGKYLLKSCDVVGCVAPRHFDLSANPFRPSDYCPKGHQYTIKDIRADGSRRCNLCREARLARRRKGGKNGWQLQKQKSFCPAMHPYSTENTYLYPTASGGVRRKCKTCTMARARGEDPANVILY